MNPETNLLLFPLALAPALSLLPALRLPRLVVRIALVERGAAVDALQRGSDATPAPVTVPEEGDDRMGPAVTARECERRLAEDLRDWRDRCRRGLTEASGAAQRQENR